MTTFGDSGLSGSAASTQSPLSIGYPTLEDDNSLQFRLAYFY
ncbi:hypothetical protein FBY04_102232 [Pseudomonas sp. SJZ080]|nr:hypothetical protein FBY04_102232 [Pseudomonas sp. SJZ080]